MPVRAGTAYIKIDADFDAFNREVRAKLHERLTQQVHVKADASGFDKAEQQVKSFTGHTDRAHLSVGKLGTGLRTLYIEAAKVTAIGLGAQAISALGAAGAEAVTALAPLGGALAAYPALASAGGQALGVWKLAFNGVTTAVGGLNDQIDKSSKAWKSLTPEGKRFAEELQKMKQPLRDLSETAQKGLLPGLEQGLKGAMANFPVFQKGVGDTAKVMGDLAAQTGKLIGSKGFGQDLQTQMGRNDVTIRRLGQSGLFLLDAVRHITLAAGPLVDWMTRVTLTLSKQIDQWALAGRESGRFAAFFEQTKHSMTDVGHLASNIGTALFNIFKDAYPAGRNFLDTQVQLSAKFKEWTASAEGQNKIKKFFQDAQPAIDEAEKLVGAIVRSFGTLGAGTQVAPLLRTLRVDLLPRLTDMVNATTKSFGKPFLDALGQAVTLFTNLGGTSGALTISAQVVGTTIRAVNNLLNVFPPLKPILASIITIGAIGKILKIDAAVSGMQKLLGLMRAIPGVNIPAIGGGGGSGTGGGRSILGEVSMARPLPVFVTNFGVGGVGREPSLKELQGRQGSGRSTAQVAADEASIAALSGGPAAAEKEVTGIVAKLGPALGRAMSGLGIGAGVLLAGSLASTVAGQVVGGKAGDEISKIGTNASLWGGLGASIGTIVAPGIGTAIGGAIGAGAGILVSTLPMLLGGHGPDFERMGVDVLKHMDAGIKKAGGIDINALTPKDDQKQRKAWETAATQNIHTYNNQFRNFDPYTQAFLAPDTKVTNAAGRKAVAGLYGVITKNVKQIKIWTPDSFVQGTGLITALNQLPAKLRPSLAASLVALARQMERDGRLPAGSAAKVAQDISRRFGIGIQGLGSVANQSLKQIATSFRRSDIVNAANSITTRLKHTWADRDVQGLPLVRGIRATAQNYAQELNFLADKAAHSTGRIKRQAQSDFNAVHTAARRSGQGAVVDFLRGIDGLAKSGPRAVQRVTDNMIDQLHRLPRNAHGTGAAAMVQLTGGLEANGKLPQGATSKLMDKIENEDLAKLPKAARKQAGQAMVNAAAELEAKGKLPANTTANIVADMDGKWQGLGISVPKSITKMNANVLPPLSNTKKKVDDVGDSADTTKKKGQQLATAWSGMVQPAKKAGDAVFNLGWNFGKLSDSVNTSATTIANTTNSVLSGLGADKIKFTVTKEKPKQRGGRIGHFGGGWLGGRGMVSADDDILISSYDTAALGEAVVTRHQAPMIEAGMAIANAVTGGQYPFASLDQVFGTITRPHGHQVGGWLGHQAGGYAQMLAKANEIESHHYPYLWGGGHNANFSPPYDCSGAVSAVLHAGGILGMPEVSGSFAGMYQPGGGLVTLYANPSHVYMSLGGKFWGTSTSNPGGGAGWIEGGSVRPGFAIRHVPATGGTVPRLIWEGGTPMLRGIGQKDSDHLVHAANAKINKVISAMGHIGGGDAAEGGVAGPVVTASWYGSHGTGSEGLVPDVQAVEGFAELSNPPGSLNFSALGGLAGGTLIDVGYGGRHITIPKLDVGAGGAGVNGHIRAIDLTGPAKDALAFPGLADVTWRLSGSGTSGGPKSARQLGLHARGGWLRGGHQGGGGIDGHLPSSHWPHHHHRRRTIGQRINPVITALGKLKKGKVTPHSKEGLKKLTGRIRALGLPDVTPFADTVTRDDALQQAAATLIPTDKIASVLAADTSWYDPADITRIYFGREEQIITGLFPKVQGRNALEWLNRELGDQAAYRNSLIHLHHVITSQLKLLNHALDVARKRLAKIRHDIKEVQRAIAKKIKARKDLLDKLHPKGKHAHQPDKAEAKSLNDQIKQIGEDLKPLNAKLNSLQAEDAGLSKPDAPLKGIIPTLTTKIGSIREAEGSDRGSDAGGMLGELSTLQGPVGDRFKFARRQAKDLLAAPPGRWLGDIFTTLNNIRGFYDTFLATPPTPDTPADTSTTATPDQYRLDLDRLDLERGAVRALQQLVLQGGGVGYPFGGTFAAEGQVPGPPGAPRSIVAHGTEWVVSDERMNGGGDTYVYIDGKGTPLNQLIDVRIERASRGSTRGAIRALPGRGGR